jgi:hypothetical protein
LQLLRNSVGHLARRERRLGRSPHGEAHEVQGFWLPTRTRSSSVGGQEMRAARWGTQAQQRVTVVPGWLAPAAFPVPPPGHRGCPGGARTW